MTGDSSRCKFDCVRADLDLVAIVNESAPILLLADTKLGGNMRQD